MSDPTAAGEGDGGKALRASPSVAQMNSSDRIIMEALQHFSADGRKTKVSMRKLSAHVGRGVSTVGKSLRRLEANGMIAISKGSQFHVASTYTLLEETEINDTGRQFNLEGLPDCFRARDLVGPGWMHTLAPKGVPLSLSAIGKFSPSKTNPTMRKYLHMLADLPVPLVSIEPDLKDKRRKAYTFHALTTEAERALLVDLNLRLPGWRPVSRAHRETQYEAETRQRLQELGIPSYAELVPLILANVLVSGESDCWLWQGARNKDGYAVAHPDLENVGAHRMVYRQLKGEITNGSEVHHLLDTCARHCVNPDHLVVIGMPFHRLVTSRDSVRKRAASSEEPYADGIVA